jgi:hypothetical protein
VILFTSVRQCCQDCGKSALEPQGACEEWVELTN